MRTRDMTRTASLAPENWWSARLRLRCDPSSSSRRWRNNNATPETEAKRMNSSPSVSNALRSKFSAVTMSVA